MIDWERVQRRLGAPVDGDPGKITWTALLARVGAIPPKPMHAALGIAYAKYAAEFDLNTGLRIAHALAQSCVETRGFTTLVESLNYSVEGLLSNFGRHRISSADAQRLGRKPGEGPLSAERQRQIANIIYGGEWGRINLGNTEPNDGWDMRGRGGKQTTGRSNYTAFKEATGIDVLANPDLLADPDIGTRAGLVFWKAKGCNALADADNIDALTLRVNGGKKGLPERKAALVRAKAILL